MKIKILFIALVFVLIAGIAAVAAKAGGNQMVGNDSDEHGCKPSAGYSWCEEKSKCLRTWEEECKGNETVGFFGAITKEKRNYSELMKQIRNATKSYGQCVSECAKVRTNCTNAIKEQRKTCDTTARNITNSSERKDSLKQCLKSYNDEVNQCKKTFKDAKKECGNIKHNIMDEWMHNWD